MSIELPITPAGLAVLKSELERLQRIELPEITEEVSVAREKGDLSENAEYHAAKEKQGQIYAKIQYLKSRTSRARVIDPTKLSGKRIVFGAIVSVYDLDNEEEATYQLVGEDEADFKAGKISITSPLARGLLGKEEGDETTVDAPKGVRQLEITDVRFPEKDE